MAPGAVLDVWLGLLLGAVAAWLPFAQARSRIHRWMAMRYGVRAPRALLAVVLRVELPDRRAGWVGGASLADIS